jgi:glycine hydroxymethyltransferase
MGYLEKYKGKSKAAIAYLASLDYLEEQSPSVAKSIVQELKDQRMHLKLIASENYSSFAVQLAMGNWLTDKYAEGVPYRRFYAGCENVDAIEALAVDEAKKLFGMDHAYVQPHSGIDANLVAFWAILVQRVQNATVEKIGKKTIDELTPDEYEQVRKLLVSQKVMGLSLSSGGHLTHGYRHNISAKMMQSVPYDVDPTTELIDYKALAEQAQREKPLILIAGYSAYPRLINFAKMKEIAHSVGAVLMVDMAHFAGLVAGKVMQGEYNPTTYADIVTSTTHKTLRGPRGGLVLCTEEFKDTLNKGCPMVLGGPLPHVMAAKAIAFQEASTDSFKTYASQIVANAKALADAFMQKGCKITTGGTDNHLMVVNVDKSFGLTGLQAESALVQTGITLNRNSVPFDKNRAWYTSGIRMGTAAVTTLGMKEQEMQEIADCIYTVLKAAKPVQMESGEKSLAKVTVPVEVLEQVKERAKDLLKQFPLYPEIVID